MKIRYISLSVLALLFIGILTLSLPAEKAAAQSDSSTIQEYVLGDKDAPVIMIEYASYTCAHCSEANIKVIPEIKKRYIDTGKVKLIYRDFPMDSISLRVAALTRCLPEESYYPFVEIIHKDYKSWLRAPQPVETLLQRAQWSGLDPEKGKACIEDAKLLDALVAMRKNGVDKYNIRSTPTFIFNDGEDKIEGNASLEKFTNVIDGLLAKHSK